MASFTEGIKDNIKEGVKNEVLDTMGFKPEQMNQLANELGKYLKKFWTEKQNDMEEMKGRYEDTIKSHPFSCTASAFAAGIIIGLLFKRN